MARHLMIGNDTAVARTAAGILDNGAIEIQKLSASGPTAMLPGDTIADSPQFRVVQGNGTRDIVSPWIYGKDVINWSGKSYVAPEACTVTDTIVGTSAAIGTLVLKFVRLGGPGPEFFSFSTTIGTAGDPTIADSATDILIEDAFEALTNIPDWLNPLAATTGTAVVFTGALRGDVAQSGNVWEEGPANIQLIVESYDGGTQTHTASTSQQPNPGYGSGFAVKAMEDSLMGAQYGYYNRVQLPKTPLTTADTAETYDMYNIVATKDGSSASQINGVDNLMEVSIAFDNDTATLTQALEGVLNPYLNSAGFGNVNL